MLNLIIVFHQNPTIIKNMIIEIIMFAILLYILYAQHRLHQEGMLRLIISIYIYKTSSELHVFRVIYEFFFALKLKKLYDFKKIYFKFLCLNVNIVKSLQKYFEQFISLVPLKIFVQRKTKLTFYETCRRVSEVFKKIQNMSKPFENKF